MSEDLATHRGRLNGYHRLCCAFHKGSSACCCHARHHPIYRHGAMDLRHTKSSAPAFKEIS